MKRGPIYVQCGASSLKEASWHIIPPEMRRSWSPPVGSPMTSAGQRRGWQSHWQILCHVSPRRRTTLRSLGPAASWAGPTIPPWRKRMMSRHKRKMTSQRGMYMRRQKDRKRRIPLTWKSKGRWGQKPTHRDDRRSGGP